MRKGQTSTEYLIILGVVIVVALIVVGALGGIPGIGKGGASKTSKLFWSAAPVGFQSYALSIGYTDQVTGANFTYTGDGNKLQGTCAN